MVQEVEITLRGEFDAKLSKTEIEVLLSNIFSEVFEDRLKVENIREEAEIYGNK